MYCFFRFSVLPAISLKGFLHCEVVEGSFRADTFALFIQNVLEHMEPFPGPNSVIFMDNCHIHKSPYIQELISARFVYKAHSLFVADGQTTRGVRCEFLPPYSPDYNPIELAFSWMKYYLRRHGDYVRLVDEPRSQQWGKSLPIFKGVGMQVEGV